jgi:hypothetical protein
LYKNLQINDNIGIDIAFHAVVSVPHHLLPDLSIPYLGAQSSPLCLAEGVLALIRLKLNYRVEDSEI